MTRFEPIACTYSALRYNKTLLLNFIVGCSIAYDIHEYCSVTSALLPIVRPIGLGQSVIYTTSLNNSCNVSSTPTKFCFFGLFLCQLVGAYHSTILNASRLVRILSFLNISDLAWF